MVLLNSCGRVERAIAPELAKKGQVVLKLPEEEGEEEEAAAAACASAASDWLRTAELDKEDGGAECEEEEEEKKEPEAADAAIPPEPRTKTELSSEGAIRAICNVCCHSLGSIRFDQDFEN